jgi:hypothetical protein
MCFRVQVHGSKRGTFIWHMACDRQCADASFVFTGSLSSSYPSAALRSRVNAVCERVSTRHSLNNPILCTSSFTIVPTPPPHLLNRKSNTRLSIIGNRPRPELPLLYYTTLAYRIPAFLLYLPLNHSFPLTTSSSHLGAACPLRL